MLAQLHLDQVVGEWWRVHRDVEVAQQIRQRTRVVLVPVRDEHGPNPLFALDEVIEVRQHEIDTVHPLLGKHQPGVDDHYVVTVFDDHHVLTDLAEAA